MFICFSPRSISYEIGQRFRTFISGGFHRLRESQWNANGNQTSDLEDWTSGQYVSVRTSISWTGRWSVLQVFWRSSVPGLELSFCQRLISDMKHIRETFSCWLLGVSATFSAGQAAEDVGVLPASSDSERWTNMTSDSKRWKNLARCLQFVEKMISSCATLWQVLSRWSCKV